MDNFRIADCSGRGHKEKCLYKYIVENDVMKGNPMIKI